MRGKKQAVDAGPIEGPWELPEGWRWERLGSLADFINGAAFKPTDWHGEGVPIIRIQNLTNPEKQPNLTKRVLPEKYEVIKGDLLLSWSATLDVFIWRGGKAWLNQHIFKVDGIREDIDRQFFRYLLKNEIENLKRSEHLHGSTMMHINRGPFLAHLVPVPPLAQQKLIAARIDALFAEIEAGEAALAQARSGVETYRKALLKAAVTGELTADWRRANPPQETGEQLLARILSDRRARWQADPKNARKKYTDPTPPNTEGLPALPEGWTWASLDQLAWSGQYGSSQKCSYEAGGEPVLRIPNLRAGGIDLRDLKRALSPVGLSLNDYVQPGDLLIVRTNGSDTLIGRAAMAISELSEPTYFASYLIRYRLTGSEQRWRWVRAYTESSVFRDCVLASIGSSAGQYNLSMGKLDAFPVAVPPTQEADIALRYYEAASAGIPDAGIVDDVVTQSTTLRQSILAAAFRGDLIP